MAVQIEFQTAVAPPQSANLCLRTVFLSYSTEFSRVSPYTPLPVFISDQYFNEGFHGLFVTVLR